MKRFVVTIIGICQITLAIAQQVPLSTLRSFETTAQDSILLQDTLPILPATIRLISPQQDTLPDTTYLFSDPWLIFKQTNSKPEEKFRIVYRVLPFRLDEKQYHLDSLTMQQMADGIITNIEFSDPAATDLIDFKQLAYSGSFARGLSFGNRQDLVLNSNFNLQLAGDLGDGIGIKAAITDENIPLQPEGNTQQLQDFDRVYVELYKNKNRLKAGDYELTSPTSYFSRFYKRLQGLTFSNEIDLGDNKTLSNEASVALARGKFARFNLEAIEGNQGPYKLRGAQGERFIIVLSGTERVWLNGQLLKRGIDEDYIIDYNLGELIFTPKNLVRRESRIIVEYEYVDQTYARSIYTLGTELKSKKSTFSVNLYSQQDAKNSNGFFPLSDEDRLALANAGDDLSRAVVSSIRPLDEFNPTRVSYEQLDTLTACGTERILVFSNNENASLVTANFTLVGSGNGLYQLAGSQVANEPVYKYVGRDPISCEPLGDYQAAIQLTPPQLQRLLTMRQQWQLDEKTSWTNELAFSVQDNNRFSNLDSDDDQGMAYFTNFERRYELGRGRNAWEMETQLSYEYKSTNFEALNPYRDPEFLRDWNLANFSGFGEVNNATEHLVNSRWGIRHPELGHAFYTLKSFLRSGDYRGFRHGLDLDIEKSGWQFFSNSSWLDASTNGEDRRFIRPQLRIGKAFKKGEGWQLALALDAEQNERSISLLDSLEQSSYAFYNYSLEISNPASAKNKLLLRYNNRTDYAPDGDAFTAALQAQELRLESEWTVNRNFRLQTNLTYRNLSLENANQEFTGKTGDNFLGQVIGNLSLGKGWLRSSLTYNIGGGQEPRRTFSFVRVRKGEGVYIWLDSLYNNDGVIQPNEMEISPFPDQAEYVRVATFTDDFIQTNDVNFNWSLNLSPKAVWFNAKSKLKQWLSRFSNQSSLRIDRRTQESGGEAAWNPFILNVADTSLIAVSSGIRNILFFNRGNPKYDIQFGWNDNRRKFLLNTGFESRTSASNFLKLRLRLGDAWTSNWELELDRQINDSEVFNNKDYKIVGQSIKPDISWVPSRIFQLKLKYAFTQRENQLGELGENTISNELASEITWNQSSKTRLSTRFSYINIQFEGQANTPVGFAILNGLQPGNNLLWNLGLEKQLGKNLRLQLTYEGRKTGTARVVHVGRAQVAAVF